MTTKLYDTAVQLLKLHAGKKDAIGPFISAVKGDKAMMTDLAGEYLDRVLSDIRRGDAVKEEAAEMAGTARGKRGPHRRAKLPTAAQKMAEIRNASLTFLDTRKLRDGRPIGDIPLWELPNIASGAAGKSVTFLQRGLEDAVDAIACHRLSLFVQPSTAETRVRDAIKPAVVEKIYAESRVAAAQRIADASARTARELLASETTTQIGA